MTDLHTLAAACWEGDRTTAALILSLADEPLALFARLDTSSKLTLIGWGLHRRVSQPARPEASGALPLKADRDDEAPASGQTFPLAEMRASTASH